MPIQLGDIVFDEARLFKQLRNDLKDDWFPDPLLFDDMLEGGVVVDRIADNFERNHGQYVPEEKTLFNLPKPNFTLRYALEVGISDRALYHGLCSYLSKFYDPLIPWYVYSHRKHPHRADDRYMFRRGVEAWQDFTETVRAQLPPGKYLLSTDLTNYYENINLGVLQGQLQTLIPELTVGAEQKHCIRSHIRLLFDCLARWSFDGNRGLAQNRDASSFLANVYMLPVDRALRSAGYEYFRYMDDIKVVCDDALDARRALKTLIVNLRNVGLSVNSKKTVLTPASDAKMVRECLDTASPRIEHLDSIWRTRRRNVISRSFPELRALTESLLETARVDSRDFRYCIARMALLAGCREFAVPPTFFRRTKELMLDRLSDNPAATDQFIKFFRLVALEEGDLARIAEYVCDNRRNFYSWQAYRLWILLAERRYASPELLTAASAIIRDENDGASRAGATLYLGAVGGAAERTQIARRFDTLKSFLGQRTAVIAMHELPYRPEIRDHVRPHVRNDLVGAYRRLQSHRGQYVAPPPPVSITSIIDTERGYA